MFKLIMKHKELRSLSWDLKEFCRMASENNFSRPEVYEPRLQINLFGFTFDLPVFGIVYISIVKVKK